MILLTSLAGTILATALAIPQPLGNKVSQSDALGRVTRWEYDALGRTTRRTLPGGNTVAYTYTPTGQVASVTDVRGLTSYAYDARDRVSLVTHPEGWTIGPRAVAAERRPGRHSK